MVIIQLLLSIGSGKSLIKEEIGMRLVIHNVGHGFCASFLHENGSTMLWDCGHSKNNRPSCFLPQMGIKNIDLFFISNYDEER